MTIAIHDAVWKTGGKLVLDGVSLDVTSGQMLGLLGPNGSGKSSLLRLICRLRPLASGIIRLDGRDIAGFARRDLAQRLALVEQQASTDAPLTALDVVGLGRTPHRGALSAWARHDEETIAAALHAVEMWEKRKQAWHTLSGGERQRVQIARALAQEPTELLLDEPTNHLDVRHQLELMALLRRLPVTSVVALHDMNLAAAFCDRLVVLRDGRVAAAGTVAEVLTPALIADVFGVDAAVSYPAEAARPQITLLRPAAPASGNASAGRM
ncbi:MAG TPA: ABC transporter ATP-binding protein [Dongiaceae bacterium]|jgi:iron complex transport system ATP-binding protein|nr:ABC transporter ATP-binding protein [Dongiaceae bacterium]